MNPITSDRVRAAVEKNEGYELRHSAFVDGCGLCAVSHILMAEKCMTTKQIQFLVDLPVGELAGTLGLSSDYLRGFIDGYDTAGVIHVSNMSEEYYQGHKHGIGVRRELLPDGNK